MNVAAWAKSQGDFEEKVRRHTETLDCILVELENVQPIDSRMEENGFPEELITMRETATVSKKTRFGEHFTLGAKRMRTKPAR